MQLSVFLCRTSRESPADIELPGHQFAARAGVLRPAGAGLHAWRPLGQRALERLCALTRQTVEAIGAQPLGLPTLHQAQTLSPENFSVRDRAGRHYTLDDGDFEALLRLVQHDITSYRQLPALVYRLANLFRDEEKPRGLLRARESVALSAASLHADAADLEAFYPRALEALSNVLRQCGLDAWILPTHSGHELLLPHPLGDDLAFKCHACQYSANADEARFVKLASAPPQALTIQKVSTPNCHTIAAVATHLNVPITQTLKTMMYADDKGQVIFAVIRGDLDINAAKLERAVRHTRLPIGPLCPATDEQIRSTGAVPGYASPVGLSSVTVIADDSAQSASGMVAGANEQGYHLSGVNVPRDFSPTVVADIAQAFDGSACPECRGKLQAINIIKLGSCARMGAELCDALGITFPDADRQQRPFIVGSYHLDLTRLLAAVLETRHDEHGLLWPAAIAPFDAHLVVLGKEPRDQAQALYQQLQHAGLSVLYDDRDESPGVKFADADLIGLPTRITVSKRGLEKGAVEIKARNSDTAQSVPLDKVLVSFQ